MQKTNAVVEVAQASTPPFSIELEKSVFKHLSDLANKEQISINQLASEMLKMFMTLHHRELKQLVETIKNRARRG